MNNTEALNIIKQLIDQSIKSGLFNNIDTALKVAEAYNELNKNNTETEVNNAKQ